MDWWKEPFFQVALPIVVAQITTIVVLVLGFISQNRRLDDAIQRLGRIEELLTSHDGTSAC